MKNFRENSDSSMLSFSGAAALLLLVAAFCIYPMGEQLWACVLAALAFVFLSVAAPGSKPARVRAEHDLRRHRHRHDEERDG
jgi:uncharacterized protein (DUF58 family)